MISFGVVMGFVFPVYANFFVVFNEGMKIFFIIGCLLAGITVGLVSFAFVRNILLKPLLLVSDVATDMRNGKISSRIQITSNDSVGEIIKGINASGENLVTFVQQIDKTASINQEVLGKISSSDNHQHSIDRIYSAIHTVTGASSSISKHSNQICFSLSESSNAIKDWHTRVEDMLLITQELSGNMQSLIKNLSKINNILITVQDVARRTNLVSVNATIEASTAGVHGKGFAVVATEINELSKSVQQAATEIAQHMSVINTDILKSDKSLQNISDLTTQNKTSSDNLRVNLESIEHIAKSNYSADKEMVVAVEKLNSSFREIEGVINQLSDSTNEMKTLISTFEN